MATVGAGDGVTSAYTMVVSNKGPSDASSVTANQTWPVEFAQSPTVTTTTSGGATPGPQTSTATVGSTVTPDSNGANDADSDVTTVVQADVAASSTDGPYDPVPANGTVVFTVTVENVGPGGANNVESDVVLPAGLTLTSTSCGATLTCNVGSLAPGEQYVYMVTAAVDAGASGTLTTNAAVTTTSGESTLLNNAATEDTTVLPAGTPTVHQYTTTVPHVSGVDATSVELVQDIPAGFVVQGTPTATVGGVPLAGRTAGVGQRMRRGSVDRLEETRLVGDFFFPMWRLPTSRLLSPADDHAQCHSVLLSIMRATDGRVACFCPRRLNRASVPSYWEIHQRHIPRPRGPACQ